MRAGDLSDRLVDLQHQLHEIRDYMTKPVADRVPTQLLGGDKVSKRHHLISVQIEEKTPEKTPLEILQVHFCTPTV